MKTSIVQLNNEISLLRGIRDSKTAPFSKEWLEINVKIKGKLGEMKRLRKHKKIT